MSRVEYRGLLDHAPLLVALFGLQLHQGRRGHHLRKGRLEGVRLIDGAMQGTRHVMLAEHALLARDEGQNLLRLLPDQLRIAPRRRLVQPGARHLLAPPFHLRGMHPHVLRRLDLKSAIPVRAMVDPDIQASPRQMLVRNSFPRDPDIPHLLMRVRQAQCFQLPVLKLKLGFFAQAVRRELPRGQQDMGVVVADIGLAMRAMDRKIHRHPVAVRQLLSEVTRQLYPLLRR